MQTIALSESASVVLDSTGSGTASIGPINSGEVWTDVTASCHVVTNTNEGTCRFYVGSGPTPDNFAGGTSWGSTGNSGFSSGQTAVVGQQVWAVWSGGDAGATAYLGVSGTSTVA
jgi:hypothetical protein